MIMLDMNKDSNSLRSEPLGRLLLRMAIPIVAAQLINMLYNIVDRVYVGHMPSDGALALTGMGVCMPVILIVTAFAAMVGSGGSTRASIAMGKGEPESAEGILGGCFTLLLVISAVLTALLLGWNRSLLLAFGASENTIEYAVSYMNIYALGTVFVQLTLGLNIFITAQGNAKMGMLTVLIGAICNILLDPVLIFALRLGVRGAAIATVISQGVSCLWVLLFLFGKKTLWKIKKKNIALSPKVVLPCVALGLATFIMQASESIISICFNSSLLRYGGDIAVGAMTILTSVMQFAMLPLQGIGQGAQPIISYNYGAKDRQRVRQTYRLLLLCCMIYSVAIWALVMLCPGIFASLFTNDAALRVFASNALRIYAAMLFGFGLQIACQMTFVAIDSALCSIVVAVVRKFILLIPLIYLLPQLLTDQVTAVYMAEPVADAIAITFTGILFYIQFKKALSKLEPENRNLE